MIHLTIKEAKKVDQLIKTIRKDLLILKRSNDKQLWMKLIRNDLSELDIYLETTSES